MSESPPTPPPLPVLPLEYAPPPVHSRWVKWLKRSVFASAIILVVGTIACWIDVESVVASGPTLSAIGVLMICGGFVSGRRLYAWPGMAHLAISGLFVGLVNALHWSPQDAQQPFSLMTTAYTAGMLIWLGLIWSNERSRPD